MADTLLTPTCPARPHPCRLPPAAVQGLALPALRPAGHPLQPLPGCGQVGPLLLLQPGLPHVPQRARTVPPGERGRADAWLHLVGMEKGGWLLIETILLVSAAGARWMHCGAVARQVVSEARRLFRGRRTIAPASPAFWLGLFTLLHICPPRRHSVQCTAQEANAGCLQCDRTGKKCTLCDEGYYQMPDGTCKKVWGPVLHYLSFCWAAVQGQGPCSCRCCAPCPSLAEGISASWHALVVAAAPPTTPKQS